MAYDRYVLSKVGGMTKDIILYTEFPANWKYFFNEATMIPDAPGTVDKVLQVKQSARRRGPGDPSPFVVRAHSRIQSYYPKTKGSARPGETYRVGERAPLGTGYRELRQFAITGEIMNVWAYAKAKAKFELILWGPNGWSSEIPAAGAGALVAQGAALLVPGAQNPAPAANP
jgi:hypothetical protein